MKYAIEALGLTKYYGKFLAVDHISFKVRKGIIFGFLGPNGVGKTTTIRMLTGLSKISGGGAYVNGIDVERDPIEVKKVIGVCPDISNLYPELSCYLNLEFSAEMYDVPKEERKGKIMDLLEFFGLKDKKDVKFANLSKGLKRRLTLAASLVHNPEILFLDEPTIGLDVISKRKIWSLIKELNKNGLTIFLTTHNIDEASRLGDELTIIDHGKIVASGSPSEIRSLIPGSEVVEFKIKPFKDISNEIKALEDVVSLRIGRDKTYKMVSSNPEKSLMQILRIINMKGLKIESLTLKGADMEDVFIELVGDHLGKL